MSDLGSLLTLEYGEAMPTEARSGHGFPVFGSNGEVGRHRQFLIPEPGIIVGRKGSVGKVTWSDEPFWPIDTTYWVKCASEDRRWIYWVLNWLPLARLDTSTGVPGLNRNDVYALTVDRPRLTEREKIAHILDTLDTAIHKTEAIIAKLKAIKQGLLHDLLTRGIDANGELRPPQAEAPHLYKAAPLGWIPEDWNTVELSSLLLNIGQGWSPDCEAVQANAGGWGVLKTTSITWAGYNEQENKALPLRLKARPELEVAPKDILITRAGPSSRVGVVAYVDSTRQRLMISDKMYRLQVQPTEVAAYVAIALSGQAVQSQIGRTLSGMAESQTNISQAIVKRLLVPRPRSEEQIAIVDRVSACNIRIQKEEDSLIKLTASKSGLMDDLLSGRVRVTPLINSDVRQDG